MTLFFGSVDTSNFIQATGEESQTIDGGLKLSATSDGVSVGFENKDGSASIGIVSGGDLSLSSNSGEVVVNTPDGSNENAVVNVEYVNNVVGTIEDVLETI